MVDASKRYEIATASIADNQLCVNWGDGQQSRFHALWLRHQCECRECGTPLNAVRGIRLLDIPEDIVPGPMTESNGEIQITWQPGGHVSTYQARWLRDHCYSDQERALRKQRPTLWDGRIAADPPLHDQAEVEADPARQLAMLESVCDYGFCKICNVPVEPGESQRLIELVGTQRQTHYGTYVLSQKKTVDNVGDVTVALPPHCDETYRLSGIGITVFQVWHPSSSGGDSTLVDGFEAARRMRETWPEDFDLLTRVPITTERFDQAANSDGKPRWFVAKMPLIRLDGDGDLSGVHFNERQIAPLDMRAETIEPCYRALRRMFEILYDPELMITFKLGAGEGLLFDNQRILHGRTEFAVESPPRSVLTSSVDLEEFHSTLRLLRQKLNIDAPPQSFIQGMLV